MSGYSTARRNMVDCQVRPSDVTDIRIIEAMLAVPREAFVPTSRRALAYLDLDLDVSEGAGTKRYLIQPAVTARMLQAAEIKDTDKLLVVGCATGYTPALLAKMVGQVTATESESALVAKAKNVLTELGLGDVMVHAGAAADGAPEGGPYDVIVLNGATEILPDRIYRQLSDGGRLVGVYAATKPSRAGIVTRSCDEFGHRPIFDAISPVLPGLERTPAFVF